MQERNDTTLIPKDYAIGGISVIKALIAAHALYECRAKGITDLMDLTPRANRGLMKALRKMVDGAAHVFNMGLSKAVRRLNSTDTLWTRDLRSKGSSRRSRWSRICTQR